uniref:FH2 domain-containing protein 1-like n=1 Tax=Styela clava TaxID=7725 RepID=UPI00193A92D3|nr:FH2 domain-containing protein 1-like [Styela clava]
MNHDIPPPPPPPPAPIAPPPPPPPPAPGIIGKSKKNDESTTKFRRFAWKKIPDVQITDAETIWSPKENSKNTPRLSVDINTIQELFAVKDVKSKIRSPSPRGSRAGLGPQNENKGPITFLDTKQSMNINIFLRQFKRSIKDVVTAIQECDTSLLSAEKLRTLCKLIPEKDELKKLEEFKGDEDCLDKADKFVLGILKIPSYKLRIECAILRDEYTPAIRDIEESLDILQKAMFEIRNCLAFPALLHLVLQAGNVLNQGVSYGNASGFRLHSLKKLSETKANQPGITMMHYVAMELEKQDHLMMRWPEQLPSLSKAYRISATETRNDLAILRKKVQTIKDCVERDKNDDLKEKVRGFMKDAESDFKALSIKEDKFAKDCNDLALYLCEQPSQFSLEECFSIVEEFRNKFIQAAKENSRKEKLKAKRERNRNISSHSFSDISAASRLSVDEAKRSLDDVEYGGRFRRRNTVDIARRRQRSPMPNRPVSDPCKTRKCSRSGIHEKQ